MTASAVFGWILCLGFAWLLIVGPLLDTVGFRAEDLRHPYRGFLRLYTGRLPPRMTETIDWLERETANCCWPDECPLKDAEDRSERAHALYLEAKVKEEAHRKERLARVEALMASLRVREPQ